MPCVLRDGPTFSGLLRMRNFSIPSTNHLMLRSAHKARLEARTTPMQLLLACALLVLGTAAARAQNPDKQSFEVIEHGRYMAIAGDCAACHTAKGGQPFAGGGALQTPFGTLLAPNITPDVETGIGGWTDDEFSRQCALASGMAASISIRQCPTPITRR